MHYELKARGARDHLVLYSFYRDISMASTRCTFLSNNFPNDIESLLSN